MSVDEEIRYLVNEINNMLRKDDKYIVYDKGVIYFYVEDERVSTMLFGKVGCELEVIKYLENMLDNLDNGRRDLF